MARKSSRKTAKTAKNDHSEDGDSKSIDQIGKPEPTHDVVELDSDGDEDEEAEPLALKSKKRGKTAKTDSPKKLKIDPEEKDPSAGPSRLRSTRSKNKGSVAGSKRPTKAANSNSKGSKVLRVVLEHCKS